LAIVVIYLQFRQTPESKFTKFGEEMSIGQTPKRAEFRGDPTRSVRDVRGRKFVLPQKWAKIHQNRLRPTPPKAPLMPNFIRLVKPPWQKALQNFFTPFNILAPQVTGLGGGVHQPSSSYLQNFVPFRRPSSRYLLPNFVDFVADPQKKHTVNDMSPHYMQRQ